MMSSRYGPVPSRGRLVSGANCGLNRAHIMKAVLYLLLSGVMLLQILDVPSTGPLIINRQAYSFDDMLHDENNQTYYFSDKTKHVNSSLGIPGRLEFVHITKTGGSAIEKAGAMHGVIWGACHYMELEEVGCYSPDIRYVAPAYQSFVLTSPWHTPPQVLAKHSELVHNPYENAELFAVVRNPYDRVLSEFYCPWMGLKTQNETIRHDPEIMNQWVKKLIKDLDGIYSEFHSENSEDEAIGEDVEETPERRLLAQKHYINQVEYVFDGDDQIVDNIIHYEHLQEEFDDLMRRHDLDIRLPSKDDSGVYTLKNDGASRLTFRDLDEESVALINNYAKDDFYAFGYEMVAKFEDGMEYNKDAVGKRRVRS